MIRFRFMIGQESFGPWRAERRQALQDARNSGMAAQDKPFGPIAIVNPGWIDQADNLKIVWSTPFRIKLRAGLPADA